MNKFKTIEDLKITEDGFIPFKEDEQLEYKLFFREENIPLLLKVLVGMANTNGGCLIIGVRENKDGAVVIGVSEITVCRISDFVKNYQRYFERYYFGQLNLNKEEAVINGKKIVLIFVHKGLRKVVSINDGKVLVRLGDRIVSEKVVLPEEQEKEFDIFKHMRFVDIDKFSEYTSINNYRIYPDQSRWEVIFKYMSLEAFIQCIENGNIMFQEPKGWDDQYEKRFYNADYSIVTTKVEDTPKMYAICATRTEDNEAAWKVYARGNTGLESRCIQLKLDLKEFRKCLSDAAIHANNSKGINCKVFEGKVSYKLSKDEILNLYTPTKSPWYDSFFSSFNIDHFVGLHLFKRPAFAYEDEVRFFMVPNNAEKRNPKAKKTEKLFVNVPWERLIKEVRIDKRCSQSEILAIRAICEDRGIELIDDKHFKARPLITLKKERIPSKPVDIDDMPGKKKIIIGQY